MNEEFTGLSQLLIDILTLRKANRRKITSEISIRHLQEIFTMEVRSNYNYNDTIPVNSLFYVHMAKPYFTL